MVARYADRAEAGRRLAAAVRECPELADGPVVVLGLPRGGVPVAHEIARELAVPMDLLIVRKLGCPQQPELAMGAVGEGGVTVMNDGVVRAARITSTMVGDVAVRERAEIADRVRRYRRGRPPVDLTGMVAVIVDDGIATGATALAACEVVRARGSLRVLVAAPVMSPEARRRLLDVADDVVGLQTPVDFRNVGSYYTDFRPVDEAEVLAFVLGGS